MESRTTEAEADNPRVVRAAERRRLVGRESALAAVRSAADAAAAGRGRLLLVSGEPGIGKSALLAEVAGDLADGGTLVLWGQCWDGDGAPAYWPWVQVLRAGVAAGGDLGGAAVVLPEHRTGEPPVPPTEHERFRLFDAVGSFLAGHAARRPVLVVLDDLPGPTPAPCGCSSSPPGTWPPVRCCSWASTGTRTPAPCCASSPPRPSSSTCRASEGSNR